MTDEQYAQKIAQETQDNYNINKNDFSDIMKRDSD